MVNFTFKLLHIQVKMLHLIFVKRPQQEIWLDNGGSRSDGRKDRLFSAPESVFGQTSISLAPSASEEAITSSFFMKLGCNILIRSQRESAINFL